MTPADAFAERLLAKFEKRHAELAEHIACGYVENFDKFCFFRGQISMLREAMDEVHNLLGPMISPDPFEDRDDGALSKGPHGPI